MFNNASAFGESGGDIWTTEAFSFNSPINNLLESGNYTLSQILDEDGVLQEIKSYNGKLIDFLSTEAAVSELVGFISDPIDVNSTKEKQIKYPYMACEIFCCEVPSVLGVLSGPGGHLNRLFDILNDPHNLDLKAVGYFGKVLTILFKHEFEVLVSYINDGGYSLFKNMLACVSSHSVLHILKKLLLPRNLALEEFEEGMFTNSNYSDGSGKSIELSSGRFETQLWCDWGSNEEILNVLLSCITTFSSDPNVSIGASAGDDDLLAIIRDDTTRLNVAELLSSVISSCPDPQASPLLHYMLLPCTVEMVIAAITNSIMDDTRTLENQPNNLTNLPHTSSLIPLSVIYAVVDHLVESYTGPGVHLGGLPSLFPQTSSTLDVVYDVEAVEAVCKAVPVLVKIISSSTANEMDTIDTQVRRCGMVCLEAVKVLSKIGELVFLGCHTIDKLKSFPIASGDAVRSVEERVHDNPSEAELAFISSNAPKLLLDAFQTYHHCSYLHETVCKFVESVIMSSSRTGLQTHLVKDCRLLEQLIGWGERKGSWPNNGHVQRMSFAVALAQGYQNDVLELEETEIPLRYAVKELEDEDPLQVEKWSNHVDSIVLPRLTLESTPLAGCNIAKRSDTAEIQLYFSEEPDSNTDGLSNSMDAFNLMEDDILNFNDDENNDIEEYPHLSKIWQEKEVVPDFNRSTDFAAGGGEVQESVQQTDSNSSPLTDWAHFPSFDEVTTTQTQQVADFSNFSTAVESNPIDSSLLSPANSSSVPPFTKSLDNECTKGMFGDETNMSSTGNEALAGPSEPTEKCNGIKAKTI